jgi:hypothetical protein
VLCYRKLLLVTPVKDAEDGASVGAEDHVDADFTPALAHRDQHDIHDADPPTNSDINNWEQTCAIYHQISSRSFSPLDASVNAASDFSLPPFVRQAVFDLSP